MRRPFQITSRSDLDASLYEGPFGPLLIRADKDVAVAGQSGIVITGPHVSLATFAWIPTPGSERRGISLSEQMELGLTITIDGTIVRLTSKLGFLTRAGRAIRIERPGQDRRYRLRGLWTRTLETDTGQPLVQPRERFRLRVAPDTGTVTKAADAIDIVTFLILRGDTGFDSMITKF